MGDHPAYRTYWQRKEMLRKGVPLFSVRRWWETDGLCDVERVYFEAIRDAASLLDVGAGDLRIKRKFQSAGYKGEYHTQDIGTEGTYTYRDLSEISRRYHAIVCLDVIEHLALEEGLTFLDRLVALLEPGGTLVLQTANAYYLPEPRSWDMTHVHSYNLPDLHAYLACEGLAAEGLRIELLDRETEGLARSLKRRVSAYVKSKILGCDYAGGIAVIAKRPSDTGAKAG